MMKGHAGAVGKICLYSNDNLVITGGLNDGRVNIYDLRTDKAIKAAIVHKAAINVLGVNPDRNLLVTGSAD